MIFLIDTNVLVRVEDSLDPRHQEALGAIELLKRGGHECQIVPQVTKGGSRSNLLPPHRTNPRLSTFAESC